MSFLIHLCHLTLISLMSPIKLSFPYFFFIILIFSSWFSYPKTISQFPLLGFSTSSHVSNTDGVKVLSNHYSLVTHWIFLVILIPSEVFLFSYTFNIFTTHFPPELQSYFFNSYWTIPPRCLAGYFNKFSHSSISWQ